MPVWALSLLAVAETAAGIGVAVVRSARGVPQSPPAAQLAIPEGPAARPTPGPAPVEVAIPRIGMQSGLLPLSVDGEGRLEVPGDYDAAGWWTGGAAPGDTGPAVIVGHRDSLTGPAIFYRVPTLDPGDEVSVRRDDGRTVTFVVEERVQAAKGEFPTEQVYGPTDEPTLRLITCGGRFDRTTGSYDDNVVVFARLRSATDGAAT